MSLLPKISVTQYQVKMMQEAQADGLEAEVAKDPKTGDVVVIVNGQTIPRIAPKDSGYEVK